MLLAFGCDHAGYELKRVLMAHATEAGHKCIDMGTDDTKSVDYADYAHKVAEAVQCAEVDRGVLVCGTGLGISMAANRHREVRAAVCRESLSAKMARAHNNANVICFGERITGSELAKDALDVFLTTPFEGGRHKRRVDKIELPN